MTATLASSPIRAPSWLMLALEARAPVEFASSILLRGLLRFSPRGDGHAVLVLPGLAATDVSTAPLRRYLTSLGYRAEGWGLGRNTGPHRDGERFATIEAIEQRLRTLKRESKGKVTLIGWSLGGVFAREVAKRQPKLVRQVITLASPFAGSARASNAATVYRILSGDAPPREGAAYPGLDIPPPVPTTSIYTRTDGVVAWRACRHAADAGAQVDDVEVAASHMGIGVNPLAWWVVADRLAQPAGKWRKFDRSGLRRLLTLDPERRDWFAAFR
jgi:pimeloyl-ACP methyl ester carboxylesterase